MVSIEVDALDRAYRTCENLARTHYENFPVASRFLPKRFRRPIAVIYAFARTADDIADEGGYTVEERGVLLDQFWHELKNIEHRRPVTDSMFRALQHTIYDHQLPIGLFFDLLSAFKQDVIKKTYTTFSEVLDYCRRSANPIGRLLLHLTQNVSEANLKASDNICTALQLMNFLQDIQSDCRLRNRCYLAQDAMDAWQIDIQDIHQSRKVELLNGLVKKQLVEIEQLFELGVGLCQNLQGFFKLEICIVLACAKVVIQKLYARKNSYQRPVLTVWNGPLILWYAMGLYRRSFC